jgi:quercetin dioxygenase-like cupin family protein
VGCWIIAHQPIGQMTTQILWYLDVFPTRSAAEAAKGPHGTVVESMGKVWLLTIEKAGWRASKGERMAEIGPLPVVEGEEYSAQYMEAIFNPGMTSSLHTHAGPEAWYTLAGETCLETRRWRTGDRAWRAAHAVDRHRHRTTPSPRSRPSSIIEASHHGRPRLDAEGTVQIGREKPVRVYR